MPSGGVRVVVVTALVAMAAPGVRAVLAQSQAPAKTLVFEAASVKRNTEGNTGVSGGCYGAPVLNGPVSGPPIPVGRCVISAARLSHLMPLAYDIPLGRVKGGPEWVWGAPRFNIVAKAENPAATYAELTGMLQSLLVDRFKLRIHREPRPMPGYVLLVGAERPKLKTAAAGQARSLLISGAAINKFDALERKNLDLNTIAAKSVSIAQLAETLSRLLGDSPVADKTGLSGFYDFTLEWEPDEDPIRVLQSQLGLRVERQNVPADFIIIDSAELPTDD